MKKFAKSAFNLLICILLCMALSFSARAVDVEEEQSEALGIGAIESALPDEAKEIMGDVSATDINSADTVLQRIGAAITEKFSVILKGELRSAAIIMTMVILTAFIRSVYTQNSGYDLVSLASAIAVGTVAVGDIGSFVGLGRETLYALSDFSKILLPSLSAASAATGAVSSAAAKYTATALFMDVLITVGVNIVIPLVYAYVAVVIANAALGGAALSGGEELLKWICKTMLILLVLAFTAYLGLTGVISSSTDAVTVRVAKTAISGMLPVVGGIISDAAGAVVSGAAMLRNAIGIFGMLVVVCTCLTPFLALGTQYLLYKATAGISGALSDSRLGGLISGIGTAFGVVLGLVGSGAIMLFISVISCMKAVGAA